MNLDSQNAQPAALAEEYSKAMNFIGQNLLTSLTASVEKLPSQLRSHKMITQALSVFLANVIHQQYPENPESSQQMTAELTNLIGVQLDYISQMQR